MVDRLCELEARQDELNARLATVPADIPDIYPNVAGIYRRKVARLADALDNSGDRIMLMLDARCGEMVAVLHGNLDAILEWTENGHEKTKTDTPRTGMSVSVIAGAEFEPATFRL